MRLSVLSLTILFFAVRAHAGKQDKWLQPNADYRLVIEQQSPSSPYSPTGYLKIRDDSSSISDKHYAIFDDKGRKIPSKILYSQKNRPVSIIFDNSSKSKSYYLYYGKKLPENKDRFKPKSGLFMETGELPKGEVNSWHEGKNLLKKQKKITGISPVKNIFHGINPHGPSEDLITRYYGWLEIDKPGEYLFAVTSDDPSFLLINGKLIAEWPGRHGPWNGRKGEHNGKIKLNKGRHKIEYVNFQYRHGLCNVAAWQPPGEKFFKVIPPEKFSPVAFFKVKEQSKNNPGTSIYLDDAPLEHSTLKNHVIATHRFQAVHPDPSLEYIWDFDDGTTRKGKKADHVFAAPGLRKVKLTCLKKNHKVYEKTYYVDVIPQWEQREEWPDHVFNRQIKELQQYDLSKLNESDLLNLVWIFSRIELPEAAAKVGSELLKRSGKFKLQPETALKLANAFMDYQVRNYSNAEKTLRLALESKLGLEPQIKLELAELLITREGKAAEALKLLREIDSKKLNDDDQRKLRLCQGDACATMGNKEEAMNIYRSLPVIKNKKVASHVQNEARFRNAVDYFKRQEYDAAESLLRQIEWEMPILRLSTSTGLLMAQTYIARQEYAPAMERCLRILKNSPSDPRTPEILLCLIEIHSALKNHEKARKLYLELKKRYPYSEATAHASLKWNDHK